MTAAATAAAMAEQEGSTGMNAERIRQLFSYCRHNRGKEVLAIVSPPNPYSLFASPASSFPTSIDVRDENGNTLLMCCAQNNNRRLGKELMRRGARVNVRNKRGKTALDYATTFGFLDFARMLREVGADEP